MSADLVQRPRSAGEGEVTPVGDPYNGDSSDAEDLQPQVNWAVPLALTVWTQTAMRLHLASLCACLFSGPIIYVIRSSWFHRTHWRHQSVEETLTTWGRHEAPDPRPEQGTAPRPHSLREETAHGNSPSLSEPVRVPALVPARGAARQGGGTPLSAHRTDPGESPHPASVSLPARTRRRRRCPRG